jgi:hypothetical protein
MPVPMPQHIHRALADISLSSRACMRKSKIFGPAGNGFFPNKYIMMKLDQVKLAIVGLGYVGLPLAVENSITAVLQPVAESDLHR